MSNSGAGALALDQASQPAGPSYSVAMTGYNAVPDQTDGDPHITASGAYSDPDIVAARSTDLADELPFGTVIEVLGPSATSTSCGYDLISDDIGLRVIADSMHPRMHNKIDIMFDTKPTVRAKGKQVNSAIALGVCKDVQIRVVGKIDLKDMPKSQDDLRLAVGRLQKSTAQPLAIKK